MEKFESGAKKRQTKGI